MMIFKKMLSIILTDDDFEEKNVSIILTDDDLVGTIRFGFVTVLQTERWKNPEHRKRVSITDGSGPSYLTLT